MSVLKMMSGAGLPVVAVAESVDLDGTNDYLSKASNLTGATSGKTFTFSAWVYKTVAGTNQRIAVLGSSSPRFFVGLNNSDQVTAYGGNSSGTMILNISSVSVVPLNTLVNILVTVDLANGLKLIYINDVSSVITITTATNDDIDFAGVDSVGIGATPIGGTRFTGRLSHVFLDNTYRDLSVEANRRLFITADRKPAASSATLTGGIIWLPMGDPTTAHINGGTGGDFVLNGTIARSGRGPNQFNAPYSDLDGAADYLSVAAVTGIADGTAITCSMVFNPDSITSVTMISFDGNDFSVGIDGSSQIVIKGANAAAASILSATITAPLAVIGRNYVLTFSLDLSNASNRAVYVNGSAASVTWTTYANDSLDLTNVAYNVGRLTGATEYFNGRLGDIFFHTQHIDLSVAANLAKFVTGTGIDAKPADLGANGELPFGTAPLIYLPMYANNAGKNYGTGGNFTVNSGPYSGARGPNEFWGNLATFNGTTSAISKTAQLTGAADGKVFMMSFYVYKGASALYTICDTTGAAFRVTINASNQLVILAENAVGTGILSATVTTAIANTTNTHVLVSIDLANASNRAVYLNNVAAAVTWTTYTNDSIDFTVADFYIGTETGGANDLAGKLAEFFFATPAAYFDITQEANRLLFRDAFGNPVDLGSNGSTPLGTSPLVYLRFDPAAFGTNSGTGGDFTPANVTDGGQL